MTRSEESEFLSYYSRVRPVYHQLFNLAYVASGSMEQAQYCVQCALLDVWLSQESSASRHGLHESLRRATVRAALRCPAPENSDWDALKLDEADPDALKRVLAQETPLMRRMLALKYGCRLGTRRIARVVGAEPRRVKQMLRRFEARARRRLSPGDQRRFEPLLSRRMRELLSCPDPAAPDMDNVFRAFQADVAAAARPSRLPARILRCVICAVLALICMLAFWFAAVLVQPPVIDAPASTAAISENE